MKIIATRKEILHILNTINKKYDMTDIKEKFKNYDKEVNDCEEHYTIVMTKLTNGETKYNIKLNVKFIDLLIENIGFPIKDLISKYVTFKYINEFRNKVSHTIKSGAIKIATRIKLNKIFK